MNDNEALKRALLKADDMIKRLHVELAAARAALAQIDRHVVGAYAVGDSDMPEPCEECGEMREIAAQALAAIKKERTTP